VLLHDGVNAVVHLRPAPVVARVATLTPLLRPEIGRSFERQVVLTTALTAAGAAVLPTSELLLPGPHVHGGLTMSFWRYLEFRPEPPTAREAGTALGELHAVLAGLPPLWDGAALDTPLDDLAVFAERGTELGADAALVQRAAELTARLRPLLGGPEMTHEAPVRGSPRACEWGGDRGPSSVGRLPRPARLGPRLPAHHPAPRRPGRGRHAAGADERGGTGALRLASPAARRCLVVRARGTGAGRPAGGGPAADRSGRGGRRRAGLNRTA